MENNIKKAIEQTMVKEMNINEYEVLEIFEYRNYSLTGIKAKYLVLMEDTEYQGLVFEVEGHLVHVSSLENFYNKLNSYNMDYIEIYSNNLSKFDYYGIEFTLDKTKITEKYIKESNIIFNSIIEDFSKKTTSEVKKELTYLFKDGIYLIDILSNGYIASPGISSNKFFKDINSDFSFNLEVVNSKYRQNLNNVILNSKLLMEDKKENC